MIRTATTHIARGLTFTGVTYADLGARYIPFGQLLDLTLLGYDKTTKKIVRSTDDGATYAAYCDFVFPAEVLQIGHMPDGEVIVAVNTATDGLSRIMRSTGWATPATATFTTVLTLPLRTFFSYGSVSIVGNTVMVSEYGFTTDQEAGGPTARRAYLSVDGGLTFATVFDLNTTTVDGQAGPWGGAGKIQHLHGCAVDPWWNMLWLAVGDCTAGSLCSIIYRPIEGGTWKNIPAATNATTADWQCLLPRATEYGTLLGSDFNASGLRRVGRAGYRQPGTFGSAHVLDNGLGIRLIGREVYQAPGQPSAPVLYSFSAVTADYPGGVVAVTDRGRRFQTVYKDPATVAADNYRGVYRCLGPTNTGKFVIIESSVARYANGSRAVAEIAPAAEYVIP